MNPRGSYPPYALSRGASSASLSTSPCCSKSLLFCFFRRPRRQSPSLAGKAAYAIKNGGEGGIRTHGFLRIAGFQDRCLRPARPPLHQTAKIILSHRVALCQSNIPIKYALSYKYAQKKHAARPIPNERNRCAPRLNSSQSEAFSRGNRRSRSRGRPQSTRAAHAAKPRTATRS